MLVSIGINYYVYLYFYAKYVRTELRGHCSGLQQPQMTPRHEASRYLSVKVPSQSVQKLS